MTWKSEVERIGKDLQDNHILLSTALILTAGAVENTAHEKTSFWLSREIVGYEESDFAYLRRLGQGKLLFAREVCGTWGVFTKEGLFVEKGSACSVLKLGMAQIESDMGELFDTSILHCGKSMSVAEIIQESQCASKNYLVPAQDDRMRLMVVGSELVRVYFRVRTNLERAIAELTGSTREMERPIRLAPDAMTAYCQGL